MLSPGVLAPLVRTRAWWLVAILAGLAAATAVMLPGLPGGLNTSLLVAWVAGIVAVVAAGLAGYVILATTLVLALVTVGVYLRGPESVVEGLLAFAIIVVLVLAAHGGLVGAVAARVARLGRRALVDGGVVAGAATALGTGAMLWWLMTELATNPA